MSDEQEKKPLISNKTVIEMVVLLGAAIGGFWSGATSAAPRPSTSEIQTALRTELTPLRTDVARALGQIDGLNHRLSRVEGLVSVAASSTSGSK